MRGIESSQLLKGVLDLAVLAVLHSDDAYGYDIVRRLRDSGIDDVGDASVYGTLRRLFQAGCVASYVKPSDEGPNRKYYAINSTGRDQLSLSAKEWRAFVANVDGLLPEEAAA